MGFELQEIASDQGNNTNKVLESEILVKDQVLNHTKEIKINRIFEKIALKFTNHKKLSV